MNACLSTSIDIISLVNNYSFYPSCANKDFYLIKIQELYNKDSQSFSDLRKWYESTAPFEGGCTLLANDNKHAIYRYDDYGLACIYMGSDNSYYSLIAQGDKDALKDNYDWILKSFKNIKVS